MINCTPTLVESKVQEDSEPTQEQRKTKRLSPAAQRFLSAMVQYGDKFNDFKTSDKLQAVELYSRSKLYDAQKELLDAEYITSRKLGNRTAVSLNPDKQPPEYLPIMKYRELQEMCEWADEMDGSGPRKSRNSPFHDRRETQIGVTVLAWEYYFPHAPMVNETDIGRWLTCCGDSLKELCTVFKYASATARDRAVRDGKKRLQPTGERKSNNPEKAYMYGVMRNHALEMGRNPPRWGGKKSWY